MEHLCDSIRPSAQVPLNLARVVCVTFLPLGAHLQLCWDAVLGAMCGVSSVWHQPCAGKPCAPHGAPEWKWTAMGFVLLALR